MQLEGGKGGTAMPQDIYIDICVAPTHTHRHMCVCRGGKGGGGGGVATLRVAAIGATTPFFLSKKK